MNRLEKSRAEKRESEKKLKKAGLALLLLLILAAGTAVYTSPGLWPGRFGRMGGGLVNTENSRARVDIFGLTYVRVYLSEGVSDALVTADGEPLEYNSGEGRWQKTLAGYQSGDRILVEVKSGDQLQEYILKVEEL